MRVPSNICGRTAGSEAAAQPTRRLRASQQGHREAHAAGPRCFAAPLMIAAVALFIVAADNDPFWRAAWRATHNDEHRLAILLSLFALVFCYADDAACRSRSA